MEYTGNSRFDQYNCMVQICNIMREPVSFLNNGEIRMGSIKDKYKEEKYLSVSTMEPPNARMSTLS